MVPILKTLMAFVTLFFPISSFLVVKAAPTIMPLQLKSRHDCQNGTSNSTLDFRKQNGLDAQKLNAAFDAMNATDPCQAGQIACINLQFAQCTSFNWTLIPCATGTSCFALPLVNEPGTTLGCDVPSDANARFEAAGVQGGPNGSGSDGGDDCSGTSSVCSSEDCNDSPSSLAPLRELRPTPSGDSTTVTTTIALPPTENNANNLNELFTIFSVGRRQLFTSFSSPSSSQTQPTPFPSTPSSPLSPSGTSSSSIVSPAVPTTTSPIVIGQSGVVTVTVLSISVSTVTVTPTNCGPLSSPPSVSTSIPTSVDISASSNPDALPGSTSSTFLSSFTSGIISSTQTPGISIQTVPGLPTSTSTPPSVVTSLIPVNSLPTTTSFGGFSFSTPLTPTSLTDDSSPTQNVNISSLLTATLGS